MKIKPNCKRCFYGGSFSHKAQLASCKCENVTEPTIIKHDPLFGKNRQYVSRKNWSDECDCEHFIPQLSEDEGDYELEAVCAFNTSFDCPFCGNTVYVWNIGIEETALISSDDALYASWHRVFSGAKYERCFGTDGGLTAIVRKMDAWGDGAVAEVYVQWDSSHGHVFVAERVNGTVRFIDPQKGKTDCISHFTNAINGATMIARIDNLEPTDLIEKCIKNRGGK